MTNVPSHAVSVVVPAYNCEAYLAEALNSILRQSCPPGEVIVVDDGSTDATAQVAAGFGDRVRYVRQTNQGSAAARNQGVALAHGALLAFLDADDLWAPDKLARQLAALERDPVLDGVFGHLTHFRSPDRLGDEAVERLIVPPDPMPGYSVATLLIRRAAFDRVGPFAAEYRVSEFIDWYARAADAGLRFELLPEVVTRRRVHGDNSTRRNLDRRVEYVRAVKAALDRRRAAPAQGGAHS
jgi:glycosyltransferase involved in cell wall biosynthesis